MFKVYLAGPIDGLTYDEATDWRGKVYHYFRWGTKNEKRIEAYSPMRAKDYLKNEKSIVGHYEYPLSTQKAIMSRDYNDIKTADLVLVNLLNAKKVSIGTVMEIAWAYSMQIPVVLVMEKEGNIHEHAMIREAIGFRTDDLQEAMHMCEGVLLV